MSSYFITLPRIADKIFVIKNVRYSVSLYLCVYLKMFFNFEHRDDMCRLDRSVEFASILRS